MAECSQDASVCEGLWGPPPPSAGGLRAEGRGRAVRGSRSLLWGQPDVAEVFLANMCSSSEYIFPSKEYIKSNPNFLPNQHC